MALALNIPIYLTLLRIALIPLLTIVFYLPWENANVACMLIFLLAGFTDWLDGYLARKMKLETQFGAFLDPVADKLMVAVVLILLVQKSLTFIWRFQQQLLSVVKSPLRHCANGWRKLDNALTSKFHHWVNGKLAHKCLPLVSSFITTIYSVYPF